MEDAVQTVMTQCELWTDNNDMSEVEMNIKNKNVFSYENEEKVWDEGAENRRYNIKK